MVQGHVRVGKLGCGGGKIGLMGEENSLRRADERLTLYDILHTGSIRKDLEVVLGPPSWFHTGIGFGRGEGRTVVQRPGASAPRGVVARRRHGLRAGARRGAWRRTLDGLGGRGLANWTEGVGVVSLVSQQACR